LISWKNETHYSTKSFSIFVDQAIAWPSQYRSFFCRDTYKIVRKLFIEIRRHTCRRKRWQFLRADFAKSFAYVGATHIRNNLISAFLLSYYYKWVWLCATCGYVDTYYRWKFKEMSRSISTSDLQIVTYDTAKNKFAYNCD
jgi:hypothetical protein